MSGMAAVWCRDGREIDREHLADVSNSLAHRGQDGKATWHLGPIGLVHHAFGVSGGSLLVSPHQGSCVVVTADARLDNRDDLVKSLGLTPGAQELSDAALIGAAYERWQDRCVEHLLGDFAFCIWDQQRQILFGARDHIGVKPFYYHCSARLAIVASEIGAILATNEVPRRLNVERVIDYLLPMMDDPVATFYQDVHRLAPAHSITITNSSVTVRRYWALDPDREIRRGSDAEYADECRDIFFEAVRCRLRSEKPVGTFLSGGLDSSSITCAARDIVARDGAPPIQTFSLVFDLAPSSDERRFISVVANQAPTARSHFIPGDACGPWTDFRAALPSIQEPYFAPNLFMHRAVYRVAAAKGVGALLDGFDGDQAVGHGLARITELASNGKLLAAADEIRSVSREFGKSKWQVTKERAVAPLAPTCIVSVARALRRREPKGSMLSAHLQHHALERQRRFARTKIKTARQEYLQKMSSGLAPFLLEVADQAAAKCGVEPRYPFFDKRFLEFCAALPSDQKLRDGWTRFIMRRAMDGVVPSEIQWRRGKANLGPNFTATLLRDAIPPLHQFQSVAPFISRGRFDKTYERAMRERRDSDVITLWRVATLDAWLAGTTFDARSI